MDPLFFDVLADGLVGVVECAELKSGHADTEMTRFRYDVILRRPVGAPSTLDAEVAQVRAPDGATAGPGESPRVLEGLHALLAGRTEPLRVIGVRNRRLARESPPRRRSPRAPPEPRSPTSRPRSTRCPPASSLPICWTSIRAGGPAGVRDGPAGGHGRPVLAARGVRR